MHVLCQGSFRDLQRFTRTRWTRAYANTAQQQKPASAFVHSPKYTEAATADPEALKDDVRTFVRALFPMATLKDMRNKLQPRARVKWDSHLEFTEHQIDQFEAMFMDLLANPASAQPKDLAKDTDFGDYEKLLVEFIRRCTDPPNIGWDWKFLDRERASADRIAEPEEDTANIMEEVEGDAYASLLPEDDDEDEETEVNSMSPIDMTYGEWWENPLVTVLFRSDSYIEDPSTHGAKDRVQNYLKYIMQAHVQDLVAQSLKSIVDKIEFPSKIQKEYADGAPQLSEELKQKVDKLLATIPDSARKSISTGLPTDKEIFEKEVAQLVDDLELESADPSVRKLVVEAIQDTLTNQRRIERGLAAELDSVSENLVETFFAGAVNRAKDDGLPQLVPCIELLRELLISKADESLIKTLRQDVPGLFTFMLYRVMSANDSQYIPPQINFTEKQAKIYCQKLRKEARRLGEGEREKIASLETPLQMPKLEELRRTPGLYEEPEDMDEEQEETLFGTDSSLDISNLNEDENEDELQTETMYDELPEAEEIDFGNEEEIDLDTVKRNILEAPDSLGQKLDDNKLIVMNVERAAIISFQHAKILLSEEHRPDLEASMPIIKTFVRQRLLDIPPAWLWAFKKVLWPVYTEEITDYILATHAPLEKSGLEAALDEQMKSSPIKE